MLIVKRLEGRSTRGIVSRVGYGVVVVLASVMSVVLRGSVPIPFGLSAQDDVLFLRSADAIVHGDWLGPYDSLTLSKGPAYPVFIAMMHDLGWQLKVGEQLTYLLAAAVLALAIWSTTRRLATSVAAFVVVALDPVSFDSQGAQLIRDNWQGSLGLLFVSAVFLALHLALTRRRWWSWAGAAILAGASGGVYWLCREEGATILPGIAIIVIGTPLLWGRARGQQARLGALGRYGCALALVGVTFAAPIVAVRALNAQHYGVSIATETTEGSYPAAYADWTRVGGASTTHYVPITTAQRLAVYRVSPAAREIETFLEQPANPFYDPKRLTGAKTVWAIRDAAAHAGKYSSAAQAQAYFARLDAEINAGCDSGVLACAPRLPSSLQSVQRAPLGTVTRVSATMTYSVIIGRGLLDQATPRGASQEVTRAGVAALVAGVPADEAGATSQHAQFLAQTWRLNALGAVYGPLLVVLAVIALLAGLLGWWRMRWPQSPLLVLGLALAAGFVMRTLLMSLISVADYDAAIARYQLAGRFLFVGAVVVGCAAAVEMLADRRRSTRSGAPDRRQAHREAHEDQLEPADDQHHSPDRQSHRAGRVQRAETHTAPMQDGEDERDGPRQDAEQADGEAVLEGDPLKGAFQTRLGRQEPEVRGVRAGDDGQPEGLCPDHEGGPAGEHRLHAE